MKVIGENDWATRAELLDEAGVLVAFGAHGDPKSDTFRRYLVVRTPTRWVVVAMLGQPKHRQSEEDWKKALGSVIAAPILALFGAVEVLVGRGASRVVRAKLDLLVQTSPTAAKLTWGPEPSSRVLGEVVTEQRVALAALESKGMTLNTVKAVAVINFGVATFADDIHAMVRGVRLIGWLVRKMTLLDLAFFAEVAEDSIWPSVVAAEIIRRKKPSNDWELTFAGRNVSLVMMKPDVSAN